MLVSFDVKSLFTNVPTEEAILMTKSILEQDSTLLERTRLMLDQIHDLSTCVKSTYFQWRETYYMYQQSLGTPMGSLISPVLHVANIFMEDFEQKSPETARYQPKLWLRSNHPSILTLLTCLNKQTTHTHTMPQWQPITHQHSSDSIRHTPPGTNQNTFHSTHNPSKYYLRSCISKPRYSPDED